MMKSPLMLAALAFAACDPTGSSLVEEGPKAPYFAADLGVDLIESPENATLANFYCRDLLTDFVCDLVFDDPPVKKETLKFSFETVFKLGNPNTFSVPLVELLVALDVFEGERQAELAALCISFCDPSAEACEAKPPAEACKDAGNRTLEDIVPTIDDLIELARGAADGTLDDNLKFRVIPARDYQRCRPVGVSCELCGDGPDPAADQDAGTGAPPSRSQTICCDDAEPLELSPKCRLAENDQGQSCELCDGEVESRVRFDLGVDAITSILSEVAKDAADAIAEGELPSFDIPYTIRGTVFFDVPVLGRFAFDFGPFSSTWSLD